MPLVATDLKDLIITNLGAISSTSASDYLTEMGNTIADYVTNNADFVFAWAAALPVFPFTPDPIIVANGSFISLIVNLTPSNATEQNAALLYLQTEIIASFALATYNITDPGFITSPGLFSSSPTLPTLIISIDASTQDAAMTQLSTQIVDWLKIQLPTAPCAGTHGPYTGAGTVTNIS